MTQLAQEPHSIPRPPRPSPEQLDHLVDEWIKGLEAPGPAH